MLIIYTGWYQINPMDGSVCGGVQPGVQAVQGALPAARAQRVGEETGEGLHHVFPCSVGSGQPCGPMQVLTAHPFSLTNNQVINRLSISKRKNACVFYSDVVKNKCNLYREWKEHIKRLRQTTTFAQSFPWASSSRCWSSWLNPSHHMAFLHCVLSNVSSNCLLQKKKAYSQSKHFWIFFTVFKWNFKLVASMKVFLHLLH